MPKPLYQYDRTGKQLNVYYNVQEAVNETGLKYGTIQSAIKNIGCVNNSFYFSYNKNFKLPIKNNLIKPEITTRAESMYIHNLINGL